MRKGTSTPVGATSPAMLETEGLLVVVPLDLINFRGHFHWQKLVQVIPLCLL